MAEALRSAWFSIIFFVYIMVYSFFHVAIDASESPFPVAFSQDLGSLGKGRSFKVGRSITFTPHVVLHLVLFRTLPCEFLNLIFTEVMERRQGADCCNFPLHVCWLDLREPGARLPEEPVKSIGWAEGKSQGPPPHSTRVMTWTPALTVEMPVDFVCRQVSIAKAFSRAL